jgi:hypothetical protein
MEELDRNSLSAFEEGFKGIAAAEPKRVCACWTPQSPLIESRSKSGLWLLSVVSY